MKTTNNMDFGVNFENLTLREKVCQMMAPTARQFAEYGFDTEKYPIGFYFFSGNADRKPNTEKGETVSAYEAIVENYKGRVPMSFVHDGLTGFAGITCPMRKLQYGAANDEELAYRAGQLNAMQQIYTGIDYCLEPSCDLPKDKMSHAFGDFVSDDPDVSARLIGAFIRGCQEMGVATTTKHFPGIGTSPCNFHMAMARNYMSKDEWNRTHGYVYRKLIEAGVMSVMTSHVAFPAYAKVDERTGKYPPATTSYEVTTELLKNELGFDGVVITDALVMGGIDCSDTRRVTAEAFAAGHDVLLFPNLDAVDLIVEMLENGEIPMSRLDDAMRRIYEFKNKLGLLDGSRDLKHLLDEKQAHETLRALAKRGIVAMTRQNPEFPIDRSKVKKICLCGIQCGAVPWTLESLIEKLTAEGFEVDYVENLGLDGKEAKEIQEKYDLFIFCVVGATNVYTIPGHIAMKCVWTIRRIDPRKRYVISSGLANMYDVYFQDELVYLNSMRPIPKEDPYTIDALIDVLMGREKATGILPLALDVDENYM
ncbi:MAG: glycoside hydrolase family 3 protein [Clostridia bacterium]|nr:glycoside hydrolase family 3 protein [Clostridia bacterium]